MKHRLIKLGLVLVLMGSGPVASQDFEWTGSVERGQSIEIKGIVGSIQAVSTSGDLEVIAVKYGRESQFADVTFEVVEHADGVTICAIYPPRRRSRPAECRPDMLEGVDIDDVDVEVEFEVRVPAGVGFIGKVIDGDIDVTGLTAEVRAMTVSGDITIETTDIAHATTVAGSIRVSMGSVDWDDDLAFTTVSGDIRLELSSAIDADVVLSTFSGDLESEFPLAMNSRGWVNMSMRGVIGQGGRELKLRTLSGDVTLARR
jgi:hypothetical protein